MRIAVASEGLKVSSYFGHCSSFTCYKIERGVIVECQNMPNPGFSSRKLAELLRDLDVRVLISGSIEREAADALRGEGIEVVPNEQGTAREAAEAFLARTLTGADEFHGEEGRNVCEA